MATRSDAAATRRRHRPRRASLVVGAALVLLALVVMALPAAAADRVVTVSPSENLLNGQQVTVSWEGYGPGSVQIRQCKADPRSTSSDCFNTVNPPFQPGGAGTAPYPVTYTTSGSIRCNENSPCVIGVFQGTSLANAAFAPITFQRQTVTTTTTSSTTTTTTSSTTTTTTVPQGECRESPELLKVTGATGADQAMQRWSRVVCQPAIGVPLDYTQRNSYGGREDFIKGFADVAVTGAGFDAGQLEDLKAAKRDKAFVYVPVTASALVCPFNVQYSGTEVYELPALFAGPKSLAGMSNASFTNLANEAIASDNATNSALPRNPDGSVRSKDFIPLARADQAFATYLLTSYFYSAPESAQQWERSGDDRFKTGITESYPSAQGIDLIVGAYRVMAGIVSPSSGTAASGTFGCVDSSIWQSASRKLPAMSLRNAVGAFPAPADESILAGVNEMVADSETGLLRPGFEFRSGKSQPGAYALPVVSYAVVPSEGLDAERKEWVRDLFAYVLGDGQKNLPPGYVPLPAPLVEAGKKSVEKALAGEGTGTAEVPTGFDTAPPVDAGFSDSSFSSFDSSLSDAGFDSAFASDAGGAGGDGTDGGVSGGVGEQLVRLVTGDGRLPLALVMAFLGLLLLVGGPLLQMRGDPKLAEAVTGAPKRAWARVREILPGGSS